MEKIYEYKDVRKDKEVMKSNVELLKDSFPGTVIAMKFYLDKKYLDSVIKEDK